MCLWRCDQWQVLQRPSVNLLRCLFWYLPDEASQVPAHLKKFNAAFCTDSCHFCMKTNFTTHRDDCLTYIFNDLCQNISSDMWLCIIKNGFRCPIFHKKDAGLPFLCYGYRAQAYLTFHPKTVPAPPSPNWTLDSGFSLPVSQKSCTSFWRSSIEAPRSKRIGRYPIRASA